MTCKTNVLLFIVLFSTLLFAVDSPALLAWQGKFAALDQQKELVEAIAKAEKSVVAIARVLRPSLRRGADSPGAQSKIEDAPAPPARIDAGDPMDPDFVPHAFGAGVIIDASGYIVTNYHVLGNVSKNDYYVWTQGRPFRAKATVKAADPWMDLAVIKIQAESLTPITFGDASDLKKGQLVIALGNPYAIARDGQASASLGIISNLSRRAPRRRGEDKDADRTLHHYGTLIQTDAALHIGSSGGALINLQGEMIGLTSSLAALAGYEKSGGFAIPTDAHFQQTLKKLRNGHRAEYGFLGVRPSHLDYVDRQKGRRGAIVADVMEGAPGAAAGLKVRDLITHVNGSPVNDANTFIRDVSRLPAASIVKLTIQRPRGRARPQVIHRTVALSKKHIQHARPVYSQHAPRRWRGMLVDYATAVPRFQELSHLVDRQGCVVVLDVERDSAGAKAKIPTPAFVSHVNDQQVGSPDEFYAQVRRLTGPVRLTFKTPGGRKSEITISAVR